MDRSTVSAHVNGFSAHYSRNRATRAMFAMTPPEQSLGYQVIVNDWELCRDVLIGGGIPIFRVLNKDIGFNDDDADHHFDSVTYVNFLDGLLAQAEQGLPAGTPRSLIYLGNELGSTDLENKCQWMMRGAERAKHLSRGVIGYNWSIENPPIEIREQVHESQAPAYRAIIEGNGGVGWHEGTRPQYATVELAIQHVAPGIGGFITAQQRYGFRSFITEFAASFTPRKGWRNWISPEQYAAIIDEAVRRVYAPYGAAITPFTLFEWAEGEDFDYIDEPKILAGIAGTNRAYPLKEVAPVVMVNMVDKVCPQTSPVRRLTSDETIQTYWLNGLMYQGKNSQWEQFCLKVFGGERWLCRLMDISEYLAPKQTVYALFEDSSLTKPGGKMCPEFCEIGKVYARDVWVQEYKKDGTLIPAGTPGTKTGRAVTYFKVITVHPTWSPEPGVEAKDVAECVYSHDYNAVVASTTSHTSGILERYFYSGGLVGFIDYNPHSTARNVLARPPYPAALPPQIKIDWWNPMIPAAPVPIPPPGTLGELIAGRVKSVAANFVNVRAQPDAGASGLKKLFKGDPVSYRPKKFAGGSYSSGGQVYNTWYMLDQGYVAAELITFEDVNPDVPIVAVNVPFVSQSGVTANRTNNDCGVACALMFMRWRYQLAGLGDPTYFTVNDLVAKTSLVQPGMDDGLVLQEIVDLLKGYGVVARIERPMTPDRILQLLRAGQITIPLVNYQYIGGAKFGHFVIPVAAGERGFWVHDPYTKGANQYMTREALDNALRDVLDFGAQFPYQGIVVG